MDRSVAVPGISVVIPVYRAQETLPKLYEQLMPAMEQLCDAFEVIFVEDCGGDNSWAVIASLASRDARVRGIRLRRNYGQHSAILCGIRAARYGNIITMDDDLQHPVSELPALVAALDDTCDVVYGAPLDQQHGLLRDMASRLTKMALQGAMGAETARSVSALRIFRTELRDGFAMYRSPHVSIDVLLTWSTSRFRSIRVRHEPRTIGVSGYTVGKLIRHAFNLMTGFSTLPLQVASFVGFSLFVFGIAVLAFVMGNFLVRGSAVPGFAFLASLIAMFSGAQMFALGIFGEYLARIHFRTMDRPNYVVRDTIGTTASISSMAASDV
jgi:undecaprenyl-phosphate 4-deoxy-4-formamido-L-arabinose transferase